MEWLIQHSLNTARRLPGTEEIIYDDPFPYPVQLRCARSRRRRHHRNNTLDLVSIPENVAWNQMITSLASPYPDLQILTVGDDITAGWVSGPSGPVLYCGNPADSSHVLLNPPGDGCPPGYQDYGLRFWYVLGVGLNRPAFQAGGIQLTSVIGGGTVDSISFAVNAATSELKVVAGLSEGTIPLPYPFTQSEEGYTIDNYVTLVFRPHELTFVDATYGSNPGYPDVVCQVVQGDGDLIAFNTATATAGSYNCGVPISLTLTPPYASVGACISASLEQNCKNQGLRGKARAACNAAQIGNCHAIFHVPSAHNPNP